MRVEAIAKGRPTLQRTIATLTERAAWQEDHGHPSEAARTRATAAVLTEFLEATAQDVTQAEAWRQLVATVRHLAEDDPKTARVTFDTEADRVAFSKQLHEAIRARLYPTPTEPTS